MAEAQTYSYYEDEDVWELYLGRTAMTHGLKIMKIVKKDPHHAAYWPDKEQSERIVTALNNQIELDRAWQQMSAPQAPEQAWEHVTVEKEGDRYHHQCPQCKRWCHRCGSCSYMTAEEEAYCSENCWKAAGSPNLSDDDDATVS